MKLLIVAWLTAVSTLALGLALDLSAYDLEIRENPKSHLAYYKRATANLAAGRDQQALSDLGQCLQLLPTFDAARFYRAKTYLRLGNFARCKEDAAVCAKEQRCVDLSKQAAGAEKALAAAGAEKSASEWGDCISEASNALQLAPKSLAARRLRYECSMAAGEVPAALADVREIVAQDKSDTAAVAMLAKILFLVDNDRKGALQLLRRSLTYDPDAKNIVETSKQLRQLDRSLEKNALRLSYRDIEQTVKTECDALGLPEGFIAESVLLDDLRHRRCEAFANKEQWERAAKVCARVRDTDPDFVPAIFVQAQLEKASGNLQGALQMIAPLVHKGEGGPKLAQLYQEIQMEMQRPRDQAPSKDLYKELGVDKDADARTIKKAYRELSKKYHPDKYRGGELTKEEAMQRMQDINEAYEILSDEDRRKDYDLSRQGGGPGAGGPGGPGGPGGFQFQQGGAPFGGGGGGFDNDMLRRFAQQFAGGGGGGSQQFRFNFG